MWIQNFFFIWLCKVREKNKKIVYLGNKLSCYGINYLETYKPSVILLFLYPSHVKRRHKVKNSKSAQEPQLQVM